jgi:hypothetical protein
MSARIKNKIGKLNLSYLIAVVSISLISSLYPQDLDNIKIGLVHSSLTKNLLHAEDKNFYPVQDWELFFLNKKISYEVFDDEGVDDYDFDEVDILILPSVEILSNDGLENLQEFLKEGKGLFILGKLGVKDDDGNNRRIHGLQSLAGIQVNEFLEINLIAKKHILYANNFLSHNVQSNSSIIVMNNFPLLYTENVSSKIMKLGEYLSDDNAINPLDVKSGIVNLDSNKGRMLWFGFQLSQISVDDDAELQKIIFNGIHWLAEKPIAWLNPWYLNFNSATVITGKLREPGDYFFELTMPFSYQSMVTKINCFLKPDAIVSFPGEIENMPSQSEIHILYDEIDYLDQSENEKAKMIENAVQILRNKTKQSFIGVMYLNGNGQKNILKKSISKYFDFVIYEDNSIITFEKKRGSLINNAKMLFPPSNFSLRRNYIYGYNELTEYKKYFDDVHKSGGIIPVDYINQFSNFNSSIESETLKKILIYSMENYSWVAPYSVIVEWLITKENISVKLEKIGEKPVLRIVIENRNKEKVGNVGIRLVLPSEYQHPSVVNRNFSLRYDALTRSYYLLVPFLLANQSTIVEVHYDN